MGWLALVPWGTIVREATALLTKASDQRSVRQAQVAGRPPMNADLVGQRMAQLEQQQRADAELMQQLAAEIAAIAAAAQATEVRARRAFLLALAAVGVAVLTAIVVWLRGSCWVKAFQHVSAGLRSRRAEARRRRV